MAQATSVHFDALNVQPTSDAERPRPHPFYDSKRPGASKPAIQRRSATGQREDQHPPGRTFFQGIRDQHNGNGARAKRVSKLIRLHFLTPPCMYAFSDPVLDNYQGSERVSPPPAEKSIEDEAN